MRTLISRLRIRLSNFFRRLFKRHSPSLHADYALDEWTDTSDEPVIISGLHTCEICGILYETTLYSPSSAFLPTYYGDNIRFRRTNVDNHTYEIKSYDVCPYCAGLIDNYLTGISATFKPSDEPSDGPCTDALHF